MVIISKQAVKAFADVVKAYDLNLSGDSQADLILGVRHRLDNLASVLTPGEQIQGCVYATGQLYTELQYAAAGKGLDRETMSQLLWEALSAACEGTKALGKVDDIHGSKEQWADMFTQLHAAQSLEEDDLTEPGTLLRRLTAREVIFWFSVIIAASELK